MKKLALVLAIAATGCATQAPHTAAHHVASPVEVTRHVATAPPGTMDFIVHEAPAPERVEAVPQTSLRPGICDKPHHLVLPGTEGPLPPSAH